MTAKIDPIEFQIDAFKTLVNKVNQIPGVHIELTKEEDPQRDALAFVIDELYRQFKETQWQAILKDIPNKVHQWNTPPDAVKASSSLLRFIQHLFESRVLELMNNPHLSGEEKKYIEAVHLLYKNSTDYLLQNPPNGKPVSLAGISSSLLPDWYLNKLYLKGY